MRYLIAIMVSTLIWVMVFDILSAHAEPVKINMLAIQSSALSMSVTLQKKVQRVGTKRIAAKGIDIEVGTFRTAQDPFPYNRFGSDLNVIFREFSSYIFYLAEKGYLKKREVLHVLAPPLVVDGIKFMGGAAIVCSAPKGGYSYSNAMEFNSRGLSRVVHSIHGFMHEVLHAIGAEHIEQVGNVMHPDALQQIDMQITQSGKRQLSILNETRAQVHKCIGGAR